MASTYQVSTEHNIYPNLTVYDWLDNGEITDWRVNANEGYVFYDTTANNTEIDPETMEERHVIYYYTVRYLSFRTNWENFSLVSVPRDGVDEKYIF